MKVMGDYGDETPTLTPDFALIGVMDTAPQHTPELLWVGKHTSLYLNRGEFYKDVKIIFVP